MKRCYRCETDKPLSEFHKNKARKDGVQSFCKSCMKERNAEYYQATPERNPQRQESRNRAKVLGQTTVYEYLQSHHCVDCGNDDVRVLEFDHVRGQKRYNISQMIHLGHSVKAILSEIEKCDVRCANCHRIVTSERAGWFRSLTMASS